MTGRISTAMLGTLVLVIMAVTTATPVAAAENPDWDFSVGLYGFMPTITGKLAYDLPQIGDTVEISTEDILENLSATVMGGFDVKRGPWGLGADVIYLKESKSGTERLDIGEGIDIDTSFELKSWVLNFGINYELIRNPRGTTFGVLAGARYFNAETDFTLKADGPFTADENLPSSTTIWNGIIGVEGRFALGKRWFIPYYLDFGAGDSDFTWQGMAGINYEWHWGSLALTYRYLDFDQGDSRPLKNMSLAGPEIGVYFNF